MSKRILICDDTAFMRMMLKNILEGQKYEVVGEAENGLDAVQKALLLKPDLVLMDITMPEMNGLDALKEMKNKFNDVKVIMCSAIGQKSMIMDCIEAGASDFIIKPFEEKRVIEAVAKVFA